jgi:3-phosphoglycerate kinase
MGLLQPHGRYRRRDGQADLIVAAFRTLDEVDLRDKRVLLRVDLNVPMENGKVADMTRIERVVPTIEEIARKGGKAILLSHFGRPKGRDPKQSRLRKTASGRWLPTPLRR